MATGSRAKVYADVNVHKPREYWDNVDVNVQKTSFLFPAVRRLHHFQRVSDV